MTVPAVASIGGERRRSTLRAQTRRRLLAAGRRAFARKGLAATNLKEDILVPARVSVGSFYHQFSDKTDLFLAILRDHSQTFRAMVHAANMPRRSNAPIDVARQSFATVFQVADDNDDLFRIMARERESHDPRIRAYLHEDRRQWIESLAADYRRTGFIPAGDRGTAERAAEMISALTVGTVLTYLDHVPAERPRLRERLIDALVQFTLGGVAALVSKSIPAVASQRARRNRKGG